MYLPAFFITAVTFSWLLPVAVDERGHLTRRLGVPYRTVRDVVQCLCAQHQRPPLPFYLRFGAILPLTQSPCTPALWSAHLFRCSLLPRSLPTAA